jgi:hypothetical protein
VVSITGTGLDPCQLEFVLVNHSPFSAIADILTDTGTTLQGELDGIQADTEDIQSRLPAALVSGRIDASVGAMAANVLTATAINNDAITAAKIANAAIDAATFAADVDAEILSYLVDDATRIDASALNTASVTTIPAILVDTGTTLDGKIDTIDSNVDAILVDTAEIGAAGAGLTEAGGTGDHLTAVPWNAAWDAEVQSEATDALNAYDPPTNTEMEARTIAAASYATAANLATVDGIVDNLVSGIIFGAAATGTLSTTQASTDLTGYADDQLIGRVVIWLSGDCAGEATRVTDYAETNGVLTFDTLTTAPGDGDLFKLV